MIWYTMGCREIFVVLMMIAAVNCKSSKFGDLEIVYTQSMVDVVQSLVRDVNALKTDNQKLKVDNEKMKVVNEELKSKISRLENNGHLQFSVADQQWQSLHMAAAAACRGSTASGGHGRNANMVYARTAGHTCDQICKNTKRYRKCDASVSIMGSMGRVKTANRLAGMYYNYKCSSTGWRGLRQEEISSDTAVLSYRWYYGYCCCRMP